MAVRQKLEFLLIRYCGDPTKGESINVGVVAISGEGEPSFADLRFSHNWRRLYCFDPLADIEEIYALEREIRQDLLNPQRRAEFMKRMGDSYSNNLRIEALQACLTESPAEELQLLSSMYLETPPRTQERELGGRRQLLSVMHDELQKAGVLQLMLSDVGIAEFTRPGDPLKLDFAYPAGKNLKLLHAVSLTQRVETGMMLAAKFPKIAAGMQAKKSIKAWLTAIIDDDLDRNRGDVGFALDMMQESGILIVPAAEMPRIAEGIRLELKA
jgi:hypothetical protein